MSEDSYGVLTYNNKEIFKKPEKAGVIEVNIVDSDNPSRPVYAPISDNSSSCIKRILEGGVPKQDITHLALCIFLPLVVPELCPSKLIGKGEWVLPWVQEPG